MPLQYGYDNLGRLTSVTDALNQVTSYSYDEVGNRLTQTDANNHTTSYQYDQRGRRVARTLPLGQSEAYTYDANGNLATKTDFNGKTTTYAYDGVNQLLSKTPDGSFHAPPVTFTYTGGRRATMTDASGTTSYNYSAENLQQVNKPAGTLFYSYDLGNNLTQLNGGGIAVNYTYDALNRLVTVQEGNTGTTSYGYDNVGNLQSVTYPNGVVHSYAYDTRNRLTNLGVTKGTNNLAGYSYTLDAAGHRTSVAEQSGRTVNYSYDDLYRLTNETVGCSSVATPGCASGSVGYTYDPVGNRKQMTSTLPGVAAGLWNYDANDRFTAGDTFDANGNTVSSGGIGNAYDFENHLIQKGGVTIVYDGDGNRVAKTVAGVKTLYLVDTLNPTGYAQVIAEEAPNTAPLVPYVYGLERISQRRNVVINGTNTTQIRYFDYDGHGSVRALTDTSGNVTDTYDYDAFGNLIHQTGTTQNVYLYSGEQFDPDLNLYYNRARYLNISTGRFWSMDTEEGNDDEPLSLHKYLYTNANPVDGIDPTGNDDIAELSAGFSISATLDSTPTLNATRVILSALPIPPYPASKAARQLVGAVYAESSTPATGGEFGNEKIAIAETFIDEAYFAAYYPKYNKTFGDGTLWSAIVTNSLAVGSPPWNQVMDGTSSASDLKSPDILNKTLSDRASRFHFLGSVLTADEFAGVAGASGIFPLLDELKGRVPVAFNKAFNSPPSKREEKIGRIGPTTFYGFKPGREAQ